MRIMFLLVDTMTNLTLTRIFDYFLTFKINISFLRYTYVQNNNNNDKDIWHLPPLHVEKIKRTQN